MKAVQKVKSIIAIIPRDDIYAEQLSKNAQTISPVLGGKAEEWITYVFEYVPWKLQSSNEKEMVIAEQSAKEKT